MGFGFGNVDEGGDVSLEVQQGMDFNASLGGAKRRPPEQRQAKVDTPPAMPRWYSFSLCVFRQMMVSRKLKRCVN